MFEVEVGCYSVLEPFTCKLIAKRGYNTMSIQVVNNSVNMSIQISYLVVIIIIIVILALLRRK